MPKEQVRDESESPDESSSPDSSSSPSESSASAESSAPKSQRRRKRGFLVGVLLGTAAGAAAIVFGRKGKQDEMPVATPETSPHDTEGSLDADDGSLAKLRSRLRDAADEARQAARDAEQEKRARFSELIERE